MIIEKLRVKNYKSLEDVEIPLRPLTVFVGPNNSGKSNIFDCLEFLRDLAFMGSQGVGTRGGFQFLVWGGDLKRAVDMQLEGQIENAQGGYYPFRYQVTIVGIAGSPDACLIKKEIFAISRDEGEQKLLERGNGRITTWNQEVPTEQTGDWGVGDQLGIHLLQGSRDARHGILASFTGSLAELLRYRLVPARMGQASPAASDPHLSSDGSNLASVLLSIQEHPDLFRELEDYLRVAVPEVDQISIRTAQVAYHRWREKGLPHEFRVPSWASSDGTLCILALLVLRLAPRLPALLCIEEPDNFIHPGLLELVADLLKSISTKTQVLVSTHSPYLLNQLLPEDLLIVEKKEGKTQVSPLTGKKVREALKVLGLGELWYSGDIGGVP